MKFSLGWILLAFTTLVSAAPPDTLLQDARAARAAGHLAAAEELYRQVVSKTPAEVALHLELAAVIEAQGRGAEAADLFLRIGQELVRAQRWHEAVTPLEQTLRLVPGNPASWSLLGRALAEERRFEAARQALTRGVELGEDGLWPLLALAAAHWETQRFEEAEALYRQLLERYGNAGPALYHYGQFLVFVGRGAEARDFLERAAKQRSDDSNLLFFLGRARADAGDIEAARLAFEQALRLDPKRDDIRYALQRLDVVARPSPLPSPGKARPSTVVLTPAALALSIDFRHDPGRTAERHLPETMGSGLAWLDFDGDGWQDLYLMQSAGANQLWRQRPQGFENWTHRSGTGDDAYGQGAVAADLDGDGAVDLYLSNVGNDVYLRNRGDGTFARATADAGLGVGGWSSTVAVADADLDGDLDLYVVRYLVYEEATAPSCTTGGRVRRDDDDEPRDYCNVLFFDGAADVFYRQEAPGVFHQATADAGLDEVAGRGLGAVWADLDEDGVPDLYVANDLGENRLFRGNAAGTFEDLGLLSGAALSEAGEAEAGMGVAVGDVDGDGDADLAVTHFDVETNTLYHNLGSMQFADVSAASGFGLPSYGFLGFGVVLADLDGDADLDAYVANGHVFEQPRRDTVHHAQRDLVLLGDGTSRFEDASDVLASHPVRSGRGVAAVDYDNDGDVDLGVQSSGDAFELLRNDRVAGPWLGVELHGRSANTDAVGARLELLTADGKRQVRWVVAGSSYQSSGDRRVLFAWPTGEKARSLEVRWPSGRKSRLLMPPSGRYVHLYD